MQTQKVGRRGFFGSVLGLGFAKRADAKPAANRVRAVKAGDQLSVERLNDIIKAVNELHHAKAK